MRCWMKLHLSWNLNKSLIATFLLLGVLSQANALEFSSGDAQTKLIELYTSEGCSSCPPADRWLTQLKSEPGLWRDFVPVAFHVDYWDYIGWQDRFAQPSHAARQRQHAKLGNVKTVYTPGFVVDGAEWRGWFRGQTLPQEISMAGRLSGDLQGDKLHLRYNPNQSHEQIIATVVLLGADLSSEVKRGENANKTLNHDFAALYEKSLAMKFRPENGTFASETIISIPSDAKAIAVWVAPNANLRPIQATGAWLVADL